MGRAKSFDVVVASTQDTPSHYTLPLAWGGRCTMILSTCMQASQVVDREFLLVLIATSYTVCHDKELSECYYQLQSTDDDSFAALFVLCFQMMAMIPTSSS